MRAMNRSAFALRETSRRLLSLGVVSLALASPWALAREGVDVSKQHSGFARLVPADHKPQKPIYNPNKEQLQENKVFLLT